jgi:hypothetical protein
MSDRSRRSAGFAVARIVLRATLLAGLLASPAEAQQPPINRLRERLVSSARISKVLRDSAAYLRQHRWIELPPDSLSAGPLRLRFVASNLGPALLVTLQAATTGAASVADSTFGDAANTFIGAAPIVASLSKVRVGTITTFDLLYLEIANGGGRSTIVRPPLTVGRVQDALLDLIGTMATDRLLHEAVQWGGEWIPAQRASRERWEEAAVDLASSNAAIARTCYAGSIPACESALGLTKVADPLTEWYTPAGWRVLATGLHPQKGDYELLAARAECVDKMSDSACLQISRARPVPIPLTFGTRWTLFATALERGGRSSFTRLTAAKGSPLEVLSTAAGVSADSLVSEWRSRVLASTPPSSSPRPLEAVVFVGWTLVFAFGASRRRP